MQPRQVHNHTVRLLREYKQRPPKWCGLFRKAVDEKRKAKCRLKRSRMHSYIFHITVLTAIFSYNLSRSVWNISEQVLASSAIQEIIKPKENCLISYSLRKHAYSNILNILTTKKWKFSDKNLDISHTSGQNIDCGYSLEPPRRGGSNEYSQSMFWVIVRTASARWF